MGVGRIGVPGVLLGWRVLWIFAGGARRKIAAYGIAAIRIAALSMHSCEARICKAHGAPVNGHERHGDDGKYSAQATRILPRRLSIVFCFLHGLGGPRAGYADIAHTDAEGSREPGRGEQPRY